MEELKFHILNTFETALKEHNICVYYQPVIRTLSNQLCGFEALSRWIDPEYGLISPNQFIPILEEHRLIHRLDLYVADAVCARLRNTINSKNDPVPVSINLSRLDFDLCDVFTEVEKIVKKYRIPHNLLNIEITESTIADHEEMMRTVIDKFHNAGHQVWMDDFGSGYSSLNALKDYNFDELKLDMRFLSSFHVRAQRILTSVVQMAKDIEIHTLAEGVETEEQYTYLRDIGCEKVQGFYFGKALPYEESLENIRKKGITTENLKEQNYYDEIGRINVLSAVPFMSREERLMSDSGKDLNSLPLAILEVRSDRLRLLFYNTEFQKTVSSLFFITPKIRGRMFTEELPVSIFPLRMMELLDGTRKDGSGKLNFVSNEEYYELKTKRIAVSKEACSILMQLNNLSKHMEIARIKRLDEGLRQIYELFDRVICINLASDTIDPVYIGPREKVNASQVGIREMFRNYCERLIFAEDQKEYLKFTDTTDLMERIAHSQHGCLTGYFRTASLRGDYVWKQYLLLQLNDRSVLELVRDADMDIRQFRKIRPDPGNAAAGSDGVTPELLWSNLVHSNILRMFWKDSQRRFLGATKGFMDYYEFESLNTILGKTDEEMNWHIHPDTYMNDEIQVLEEGTEVMYAPGRCIARGQNRDIVASKWPLFDNDGKIMGLMGFFIDRENINTHTEKTGDVKLRDILTGLYNSRGISEVAYAFRDEYYLRNIDFVRFNLAIDNFSDINKTYGFDFGDKVLASLGQALRKTFGQTSAVARVSGYQFVILRQIRQESDPDDMQKMLDEIPSQINEINGIPFSFYISSGYSRFSETEDIEEQVRLSQVRQLADHEEDTTLANRINRSAEIFSMYDDLPIAYAVYKVIMDEDNKQVLDATIFYANHRFMKTIGMNFGDLLGRRTRELIPTLDEKWYTIIYKAAIKGEVVIDRIHLDVPGVDLNVTASQVIHPGYAAFTYQVIRK